MDHNAVNDIRQAILDGAKLIAASNMLLAETISATSSGGSGMSNVTKSRLVELYKKLGPSAKNPIS